jgi:hypothetical protein
VDLKFAGSPPKLATIAVEKPNLGLSSTIAASVALAIVTVREFDHLAHEPASFLVPLSAAEVTLNLLRRRRRFGQDSQPRF